jgi:anti-sigma regulatory factor (Ser/Thr protein kinase)
MRCKIASLEQMGPAVGSLMKYAELSARMNEETSYYLRVVLSELITNSFKYGGGNQNQVKVEVDVRDGILVVTVDDGGRGIDSKVIGNCADIYSEGGRGLAIVKGLCRSVELNPAGNRVTASLALQ